MASAETDALAFRPGSNDGKKRERLCDIASAYSLHNKWTKSVGGADNDHHYFHVGTTIFLLFYSEAINNVLR